MGAATFEVTAISKAAASVPTATPKLAGYPVKGEKEEEGAAPAVMGASERAEVLLSLEHQMKISSTVFITASGYLTCLLVLVFL